jgi:mono/diheme cytochrome c family protein
MLRRIGLILGGIILLLVVVAAALHFFGLNRLGNGPDIEVATLTIPTDEASLARGEKLARLSSCVDCHGPDLGGTAFMDAPPIGYIPAPNLTGGAGGIGATYTPADWDRALRHGVAADGRALGIMPSYHYAHYGDEDLAALIAYLQTVPPVDNDLGVRRIDFPGSIIFGVLAYSDAIAPARIDHDAVGGPAPAAEATAEYGEYLVNVASCNSCHGENLAGSTDPNTPAGPNITSGGQLQNYDEAKFAAALHTGVAGDGRQMSDEMPWKNYTDLTEVEVGALWAYLSSLPATPTNSQ